MNTRIVFRRSGKAPLFIGRFGSASWLSLPCLHPPGLLLPTHFRHHRLWHLWRRLRSGPPVRLRLGSQIQRLCLGAVSRRDFVHAVRVVPSSLAIGPGKNLAVRGRHHQQRAYQQSFHVPLPGNFVLRIDAAIQGALVLWRCSESNPNHQRGDHRPPHYPDRHSAAEQCDEMM